MFIMIAWLVCDKKFATHMLELLVNDFPDLGGIAVVEMLIPLFTTDQVLSPGPDGMTEIIASKPVFKASISKSLDSLGAAAALAL